MTAREYLKRGVEYGQDSQVIWKEDARGRLVMVAEIRGWGNMTGTGAMNLPEKEAAALQDEIGQFIADAINEKLEREKEKQ